MIKLIGQIFSSRLFWVFIIVALGGIYLNNLPQGGQSVTPTEKPMVATATPRPTVVVLTPTPFPTRTPVPTPTPCPRRYTVKPKNTLYSIAKDNGTTVEVLIHLNGITDPNIISPGKVLCLP